MMRAMARAIASATVSFGLVSIPVKLFTPTRSESKISFRMLHEECGSRLKQQYVCTNDGEIVSRKDMIKGYEFAKDRYVTFTNEEIKAAEESATKAIQIDEFVPLTDVDPIFFDKAYYLGPDAGGEKPYHLLAEALRQSGLAGVAQYAARGKAYLVLVRATDEGLIMQQMRYAGEVRSFDEVPLGEDTEVRDQELQLALQIIAMSTAEAFDPSKYEDTVHARLEEMIQAKVDGQDVMLSPAQEPQAQVVDLMAALKASLSIADDEAEEPLKKAESA